MQTDLQGGESPPEAVPDLRSKECFPEAVPHLRGKASITTVATGAPASRGPGSTCQLRACRAAVESSNKHCYCMFIVYFLFITYKIEFIISTIDFCIRTSSLHFDHFTRIMKP